MKLYCFPIAPNPTKVRIYLAEKGIEIDPACRNLARWSADFGERPRANL